MMGALRVCGAAKMEDDGHDSNGAFLEGFHAWRQRATQKQTWAFPGSAMLDTYDRSKHRRTTRRKRCTVFASAESRRVRSLRPPLIEPEAVCTRHRRTRTPNQKRR